MSRPPKYKLVNNYDWLYQEYAVKKRSMSCIARQQQCSAALVSYYLEKLGIEKRPVSEACAVDVRHPLLSDSKFLYGLYVEEGLSCREISTKLGCSSSVVKYWLEKMGIEIRPSSHYHVGSFRSEETKKKISLTAKGRKHTDESRKKMSKARQGIHRGSANPAWKCGRTKLNTRLRRSKRYREWRQSVLERDGGLCVLCGSADSIAVDHIEPWFHLLDKYKILNAVQAEKCEGLWDVDNGRTLCQSCHENTETYLWKAKDCKK